MSLGNNARNLKKCLLTENACYKANRKHEVKGILVHSTGANNPNLCRYVQPDDGLLGKNKNNNSWNQATPDGRQVCVNAFIGKLANGSVATYQTLPWEIVGWHNGSGDETKAKRNGFAGNNANFLGYLGFVICEDALTDKAYFDKVYTEAAELCAHLCKTYGIKPEKPFLICHSEGNTLGIASNHGNVMHWFSEFGKSMDTSRADVAKLPSAGNSAPVTPPQTTKTPIMGKSECTAEQLNAYAKKNNPNTPEYGVFFIEEGNIEGVRGDIAFCQSCLETGFFKFGGDVSAEQNNFCGLGAVGGGAKGTCFATAREGVRAQIQHLKCVCLERHSETRLYRPALLARYSWCRSELGRFERQMGCAG